MNSISKATIEPFFLVKSFNEAVNGGESSDFLSLAKKVLNVAFPIIALVNLFMIPGIMIYNRFFAKYDQETAVAARVAKAERAAENEVLKEEALNDVSNLFAPTEAEVEAQEINQFCANLFAPTEAEVEAQEIDQFCANLFEQPEVVNPDAEVAEIAANPQPNVNPNPEVRFPAVPPRKHTPPNSPTKIRV
jgi:hypothetical protein